MTGRTLRDTWVITKRNLRRYVRLPQLLFFSSVQPVMFLLLFNYVFGGALGMSVQVPGGKYIDYLAFVRNQPVTMVVDAARQLALGIDGHGAVWRSCSGRSGCSSCSSPSRCCNTGAAARRARRTCGSRDRPARRRQAPRRSLIVSFRTRRPISVPLESGSMGYQPTGCR